MTKNLIYILIFFILISCTPKKIENIYGVQNLLIKQNSIFIKETNRNDILKIFGEPTVKDFLDPNVWIYNETKESSDYFGKKQITKSDTIILKFNSKGILIDKQILNIDQIKNLEIDTSKTQSLSIESSLLRQILTSTRKRIQNNKDRFK